MEPANPHREDPNGIGLEERPIAYVLIDPSESAPRYHVRLWETQRCRVCRQAAPTVKFKNRPHVVPSFLGNRSLYTHEECDSCNSDASVLEDALSRFLTVVSLTSGVRPGRGTVRKHARASGATARLVAKTDSSRLDVTLDENDDTILAEMACGGMRLHVKSDPFRPRDVARCLALLAVRLVPLSEWNCLSHVRDWVGDGGEGLWGGTTVHFFDLMQPRKKVEVQVTRLVFGGTYLGPYRINVVYGSASLSMLIPHHRSWLLPQFGWEGFSNTFEARSLSPVTDHFGTVLMRKPDWVEPPNAAIAARAYEIWDADAREHGKDLAHWLEAEEQLRIEEFNREG